MEAFVTTSECGCLRKVQYPQGFQEADSIALLPWKFVPAS